MKLSIRSYISTNTCSSVLSKITESVRNKCRTEAITANNQPLYFKLVSPFNRSTDKMRLYSMEAASYLKFP